MRLLTNDPAVVWQGEFFNLEYSRSTMRRMGLFLTQVDEVNSIYDSSRYNYVNSTNPDVVWYNYEDAEILGSLVFSPYTSVINATVATAVTNTTESTGDEVDEVLSDLVDEAEINSDEVRTTDGEVDPELALVIWENRDIYTEFPQPSQLLPLNCYFLSVVKLDMNPYYWTKNIYDFSNRTSYFRNQSYISPMFKQIGYNR